MVNEKGATSSPLAGRPNAGTKPELEIRRVLHAQGLRYRLQVPIEGMPRRSIDIAFPSEKVAVFVDGCFWHLCSQHAVMPKTNSEFWSNKLAANRARDVETSSWLVQLGWQVIRIWEHEDPVDAASIIGTAVEERRKHGSCR